MCVVWDYFGFGAREEMGVRAWALVAMRSFETNFLLQLLGVTPATCVVAPTT